MSALGWCTLVTILPRPSVPLTTTTMTTWRSITSLSGAPMLAVPGWCQQRACRRWFSNTLTRYVPRRRRRRDPCSRVDRDILRNKLHHAFTIGAPRKCASHVHISHWQGLDQVLQFGARLVRNRTPLSRAVGTPDPCVERLQEKVRHLFGPVRLVHFLLCGPCRVQCYSVATLLSAPFCGTYVRTHLRHSIVTVWGSPGAHRNSRQRTD